MNTPDAIRLLAEARQLARDGQPTPASQAVLTEILTRPTDNKDKRK